MELTQKSNDMKDIHITVAEYKEEEKVGEEKEEEKVEEEKVGEEKEEHQNVVYSKITANELTLKFKWFERKEKGKWWNAYGYIHNQMLLDAFKKSETSVNIENVEVDLKDIVELKKKKNVWVQSIGVKDDIFVIGYGRETDAKGKTRLVRMMCITNSVSAAKKEDELKRGGTSMMRLKRRYSSSVIFRSGVNVLERVLLFMGKKTKNTKDGDIDSKIWYHFRRQVKGRGVSKLNLVEMYVDFERRTRSSLAFT